MDIETKNTNTVEATPAVKEGPDGEKKRPFIARPVPGDDWRWVEKMKFHMHAIGDTIAKLVDRFYPTDYHAGFEYVGSVVNSSAGACRKDTIQLVKSLVLFHEAITSPELPASFFDDLELAEASHFMREAGITRDEVEEVLQELGQPVDPTDDLARLVAWLLDYLRDDSIARGRLTNAFSWRYLRWRGHANGKKVPQGDDAILRDGPTIRLIDPAALKVGPGLRDLLPRPSVSDRLAMRDSIERERRVREAIRVRASDLVIIDGHLRHEEALRAGLTEVPIIEEFVPDPADTWRLVVAGATQRRQLSEWQRVRVAAKVLSVSTPTAATLRETIAAQLGFPSRAAMDDGMMVMMLAPPELVEKLDAGTITVTEALGAVRRKSMVRPVDPTLRRDFEASIAPVHAVLDELMRQARTGKFEPIAGEASRALELLREFLRVADRISTPITLPVNGGPIKESI